MEIGKRIEAEIGERRGRPKKDYDCPLIGDETPVPMPGKIRQNFGDFEKGERTDAIAARKAGFGNAETFRQAKRVVDHGAPELIEAMDR